MPKLKTHRASAKRFRITKSGKVKAKKAYRSHILTSKSPKRKRQLRKDVIISKTQAKNIKKALPYK